VTHRAGRPRCTEGPPDFVLRTSRGLGGGLGAPARNRLEIPDRLGQIPGFAFSLQDPGRNATVAPTHQTIRKLSRSHGRALPGQPAAEEQWSEKLRRIEALFAQGRSDGEKVAAQRARATHPGPTLKRKSAAEEPADRVPASPSPTSGRASVRGTDAALRHQRPTATAANGAHRDGRPLNAARSVNDTLWAGVPWNSAEPGAATSTRSPIG